MIQLSLPLEASFRPGDAVQRRDGRRGVVVDPVAWKKRVMATHTLVKFEGGILPIWVMTELLARV